MASPRDTPVPELRGLRLSVVSESCAQRGGTERYLELLRESLTESGVELEVLTRDDSGDRALGPLLDDTPDPRRVLAQLGPARALAADLARERELVLFLGCAPFALSAAVARRVPTLLSIHTPFLTCPAGSRFLPGSELPCARHAGPACLAVDAREGCLRLQDGRPLGLRGKLSGAWTRAPRTAWLLRAALGVVVNSEATRRDVLAHGAPRRVWRVHPPCWLPAPLTAAPRRERLVCVGRLTPLKGVADAIEVAALLPEVTLEVIGEGSERPALEARARALGLGERVVFRGWLPPAGVAEALAGAGALLIPSRCFETFCQVGPQALQLGCPVVGYDVGGMSDWAGGPQAQLVPVGDRRALAAAARAALDLPREPGGAAPPWAADALDRFGPERFGREWRALLLEARQAARAGVGGWGARRGW